MLQRCYDQSKFQSFWGGPRGAIQAPTVWEGQEGVGPVEGKARSFGDDWLASEKGKRTLLVGEVTAYSGGLLARSASQGDGTSVRTLLTRVKSVVRQWTCCDHQLSSRTQLT